MNPVSDAGNNAVITNAIVAQNASRGKSRPGNPKLIVGGALEARLQAASFES